jgi:hypothetical protein
MGHISVVLYDTRVIKRGVLDHGSSKSVCMLGIPKPWYKRQSLESCNKSRRVKSQEEYCRQYYNESCTKSRRELQVVICIAIQGTIAPISLSSSPFIIQEYC